jgi:opacity protein-like surface antigen
MTMGIALRMAAAGVLLASSSAALAQRADDKFFLKGGAFISDVSSTFRIDGNDGQIGSEISLEKDFDLEGVSVGPYALAGWRFSKHWRFEFEYFSLSREGNAVIDREIRVGDTVYPVNGDVSAGLTTDIYRFSIGWSFLHGQNYELGANLGFYLNNFGAFVEGQGTVDGVGSIELTREQRNQLVPLPTLGVYGRYDINNVWSLNGRVDYFSVKIDQYKGSIIDVSGGISARVTKNLGLGAEFRYVDYGLTATAEKFTGQVDYNFYGPFLFVELGF